MKRCILPLIALTALLALPAFAEDGGQAGDTTLIGEYNWNQGVSGDLKAVFTPDGEGQWQVSFHFDFRDKPHTYSGTATGNLSGKLEGTVKNESKRRTFTFEGAFEDGVFNGNHAETTPGRAGRTGTLMLK